MPRDRFGNSYVDGDAKFPVSLSGSNTLVNGAKDVTTAGTAEALASSQAVRSVVVRAKTANTGVVYVGDSSVAAANGFPLAADEAITLTVNDLAAVYLDVATSGEGVTYIAEAD